MFLLLLLSPAFLLLLLAPCLLALAPCPSCLLCGAGQPNQVQQPNLETCSCQGSKRRARPHSSSKGNGLTLLCEPGGGRAPNCSLQAFKLQPPSLQIAVSKFPKRCQRHSETPCSKLWPSDRLKGGSDCVPVKAGRCLHHNAMPLKGGPGLRPAAASA